MRSGRPSRPCCPKRIWASSKGSRRCPAWLALPPTPCARRGGLGVDLQERAAEHPRLQSIANLEAAVVAALPPAMMRPANLVAAGTEAAGTCPGLFGPVEIVGITELSPVWRPLLHAIAGHLPVWWIAGPRPVPDWLDDKAIEIVRDALRCLTSPPSVPLRPITSGRGHALGCVSCSRPAGRSPPTSASPRPRPASMNDHLLTLRADANLDLHSCTASWSRPAGRGRRRRRSRTSCCAASPRRGCAG